ncbi:hypothetical protein G6F57_017204 [Rhizopus arrhizus]|nr:hypothetical protein G6F57_017204 [Rhizopus arrhizus]
MAISMCTSCPASTAPGALCGIPLKESIKARIIGALGAAALARQARRDGLRTNRRLLGVYGFDGGKRRYADLLQNWLFNAHDGDLLMCHPAMDCKEGSPMSRQRRAEFDVLASAKLGDWMRANGVRIARLPAFQQPRARGAQRAPGGPHDVDPDMARPAGRVQFHQLIASEALDHPARQLGPAESQAGHFQQHQITRRRPRRVRRRGVLVVQLVGAQAQFAFGLELVARDPLTGRQRMVAPHA